MKQGMVFGRKPLRGILSASKGCRIGPGGHGQGVIEVPAAVSTRLPAGTVQTVRRQRQLGVYRALSSSTSRGRVSAAVFFPSGRLPPGKMMRINR